MAFLKIKIVQQQHFIEGDVYHAYLWQPQLDAQIIIACNVKQDGYLAMCEKLEGLKFRLEQLGNKVNVDNVFEPDPNFETRDDALKHLGF